jgi:hypothetical protein
MANFVPMTRLERKAVYVHDHVHDHDHDNVNVVVDVDVDVIVNVDGISNPRFRLRFHMNFKLYACRAIEKTMNKIQRF